MRRAFASGRRHVLLQRNEDPALVFESDGRGVEESIKAPASKNIINHFRSACRHLSHPVVLITSRLPADQSIAADEARDFGVTVSSFTSVSLNPDPIVSFNLKLPSGSWNAIFSSGRMRIHILSASASGAAIADSFAQPASGGPFAKIAQSAVKVEFSPSEPACIAHPGGVVGHLTAELIREKCVECGDHMIVVAKIVACSDFKTAESSTEVAAISGLSYFNRKYRQSGQDIQPELPSANPKLESPEAAKSDLQKRAKLFIQRLNNERAAAKQRKLGEQQTRPFSTLSRSQTSTAPSSQPSLSQTTVADFLSLPLNNLPPAPHPPRMRSVLHAQKTLSIATRALSQHHSGIQPLDAKTLTKLQNLITNAQNHIIRKLAYVAALDLRIMLDRGKFEGPRVGWLEGMIERGLGVCGSEARRLEGLFEKKKIDARQFESLKGKIAREFEVLRVEVERLRGAVAEDVEG
jgi:flavin reductase (DIM6/NTAB) family NADH-FMN oxidoreductase RutF